MQQSPYARTKAITWKIAVQDHIFLFKLGLGVILLCGLLAFLPFFFEHIEQRSGPILRDVLLKLLPAMDMSVPLFITIWGTSVLLIYRCYAKPQLLLSALYSFIFVIAARTICIELVALDPPARLTPLVDPISNYFYGKENFVTKDLFFSGHCATMYLVFFSLNEKRDRMIALTAALLVTVFVLVQHVHYTMDVLAAPLFSYMCCRLGKKVAQPV
ncbi:PAP2 superfamily C-terminal [bacterium A37T11]|nr:PAP2 superfamily C-terminal [bacterium A37T11]